MKIDIGKFDSATGQVPVTFTHAGVVHQRHVNACFDAAGKHDRKATIARVDQVALGVVAKIEAGALGNAPAL